LKKTANSGEIKKLSDSRKTTEVIPPVVEMIEVKIALRTIPVEIRAVAVAIWVPPDRTIVHNIAHVTIL